MRSELKKVTYEDEKRIMKFLKIGLRAWEKETHPVPGPEITPQTLIILKMMSIIDNSTDNSKDKIKTVKQLLELNHKLNRKRKK